MGTADLDEFAAGFDSPDESEWMSLVDKALRGKPIDTITTTRRDGIDVGPLYRRPEGDAATADGFPGQAPFTRGIAPAGRAEGAWDVRCVIDSANPTTAAVEAIGDLTGGATSLTVRFDEAARRGLGPGDDGWADAAGVGGLLALDVDALDAALNGVFLEAAAVHLEAGASFECAAELLVGVWQRRGIDPAEALGGFGADPVGALAANGSLPGGIAEALAAAARLAARTHEAFPEVTALSINTAAHAEAGATPVQQLAAMLATGRTVLEAVTDGGLSLEATLAQVSATVTLDADIWGGIALLRAARRCWSHLATSAGAPEAAAALALHARTSGAMMTRRDPWVNLLRGTAATFAAAVGGAESMTVAPFDAALGHSDGFARRMARNTQLLAQDESGLGRIIDPAGGSWYVESLTDALCEAAWDRFQEIERRGGMVEALTSGWWGSEVRSAREATLKQIATRARPITGVSEFPLITEDVPERPAPDLAPLREAALERWNDGAHGAGVGDGTDTTLPEPLGTVRWSQGWEALRQRSDDAASAGARPRVFLANLGPPAVHIARASWARNAFEAAGIEAVENDGFESPEAVAEAFAASGAPLVVLCSSDDTYDAWGAAAVEALAAHQPRRLYVAGRTRPAFEGSKDSIDAYAGVGVNLLDLLGDAHDAVGT
ncbi:MAG: methylmalonyl-CoA mutase family protein [Microthrixaceae bacterium]